MLQKLQNKWNVSAGRLILVIATFAIGGSLCGYMGRKILNYLNIDKGSLWVLLYILLVTLLWPITVLIISLPLGQFNFFKKYIKNLILRIVRKIKR